MMDDLPDDWEDRLDEAIARAEQDSRQATNARFGEITAAQTWTGETDTSGPRIPLPGECHPFYARNGFVLDWINGISYLDSHTLCIPKPRRLNLAEMPTDGPPDISQDIITLTRHRCFGFVPYVGRPFVYAWEAAIDGLGRAVATDAHIRYTDPAQ